MLKSVSLHSGKVSVYLFVMKLSAYFFIFDPGWKSVCHSPTEHTCVGTVPWLSHLSTIPRS